MAQSAKHGTTEWAKVRGSEQQKSHEVWTSDDVLRCGVRGFALLSYFGLRLTDCQFDV